jgi:peptide/nickel transport system permease protein
LLRPSEPGLADVPAQPARARLPDLSAGRKRAGFLREIGRSLQTIAQVPRRNAYAAIGLLIYLLFVLTALLADQLIHYRPLEILFSDTYQLKRSLTPSSDHWLGTTQGGRDIYSQLVMGTRSALAVGFE